MRSSLWLMLGCTLPLAACSHAGGSAGSGSSSDSAAPPPHVAGSPQRCNPEKLEGLAGRTADEATVKQVVEASGARTARVVKPGMAVTMDFREDRVTIEVDAQNRIVRANCG
ncbi:MULTISPECIES: I78 family peptidase inhibitor [Stenotrophomonas]|uniref:I78 family peptidase inhibitor n=1 Tax=Stenotrophomonas TaxID=40323 RepID=UPI002894A6F8|nr:I78 family peptidase inhibitor [Stenotrophomonas maltophilia]MDT3502049.1 I78 family peptidase inhibitor [Stenotrophomonas maltophilia]